MDRRSFIKNIVAFTVCASSPLVSQVAEAASQEIIAPALPSYIEELKAGLEYILGNFSFETNDEYTRYAINTMTNEWLRDYFFFNSNGTPADQPEFKFVCDQTNNNPVDQDSSRLRADLYVKPSNSVEFINIQAEVNAVPLKLEPLDDELKNQVKDQISNWWDENFNTEFCNKNWGKIPNNEDAKKKALAYEEQKKKKNLIGRLVGHPDELPYQSLPLDPDFNKLPRLNIPDDYDKETIWEGLVEHNPGRWKYLEGE